MERLKPTPPPSPFLLLLLTHLQFWVLLGTVTLTTAIHADVDTFHPNPDPNLDPNSNPNPNLSPHLNPFFPDDGDIYIGYITGSLMLSDGEDGQFYDRPGTRISGALTYALEQVNKDPEVLPAHTLRFLMAETYGKEEVSIRETALLLNEQIAAYMGPQETCTHEGRIAAAFNVPMISYSPQCDRKQTATGRPLARQCLARP